MESSRSGPGRPSFKIEINFRNPQKSINQIEEMCSNDVIKENIRQFAMNLLRITDDVIDNSTQTETSGNYVNEMFFKNIQDKTQEEQSYYLSSFLVSLDDTEKLKILMMFYEELEFNDQCSLLAFIGDSLNQSIYEASSKNIKPASTLNLDDLKNAKKSDLYDSCDQRVKYFIDNLTKKSKRNSKSSTNFKSNIYENILKSRNDRYTSPVGIKEHMVVYLSSGKSRHTSQVFSKQGGKSTRTILDQILVNSEEICKFKPPENAFLFYSYDNIQTLLKSYRLGGDNQKKALAIVVCSILCLMFESEEEDLWTIQYDHENTPAMWYTEYAHIVENDIFVEKLSSSTLKRCIQMKKEEIEMVDGFFENELKDALDIVSKDIDQNLLDSVDLKARMEISKKRKLCHSGHINDNVRSNRTTCDRDTCSAKLKENEVGDGRNPTLSNKTKNKNVENEKAKQYLNVPIVSNKDIPKEMAVKALEVNPNTPDRVAKVLDDIIASADMGNKYSVKIVFEGDKVTKVCNESKQFRKFVVVTCDGLPYKAMIELIKNVHTCANCGKKLRYLADLTDHMKETQHREYYQTYGNILPNIGHFHFALTMLRSLVKLEWDIDYQELVKSIHFESPKALFMQQKVTDFRKSLDTYRIMRSAKLREFVTPFVKYSKENNLDVNVPSFLLWKRFFVKSKIYNTMFEIEKIYGTSFLLFHASLRANNYKIAKIAKKRFSSLFHINQHPNYAVMDIHTEYLDTKLEEKVPKLQEYLDKRRCTNFTGMDYANEPHDERHEEFNKRGLGFQNIKTSDHFKQSFQLVDHFTEMKETLFEDYNIKMHGGNISTIHNNEDNILKMRVAMRKKSYLNKPEHEIEMLSLDNKELNPKLLEIESIAQNQRQENIMNVIRHNNFNSGYSSSAKIEVLKDNTKDALGMNYETQLNILIASEENPELRENLTEYCRVSKLHPDFDEEKIVDDILCRNFSFLE